MPTENNPAPFKREERYITLKLNRLAKDEAEYLRDCQSKAIVECVVVESDWPEYHLVWLMLEHRMAGKPVPDFNVVRHVDALQQRLTSHEQRNCELVALLECVNDTGQLTRLEHEELEADICSAVKAFWDNRAATLKPAESGASHE